MKSISIVLFLAVILFASCNNNNNNPKPIWYVNGKNLTAQELSFIPYLVNDTFSFSNGAGDSLIYTCISRVESRYDENGCPGSYDQCTIYNYDKLISVLDCKNNLYDFNLTIYQSGGLFTGALYKRTGQYYVNRHMNIDSTCVIENSIYSVCIDSIIFNNKKYYHVAKLYNPSNSFSVLDTFYYSRQSGILRFCLAGGEVWTKR